MDVSRSTWTIDESCTSALQGKFPNYVTAQSSLCGPFLLSLLKNFQACQLLFSSLDYLTHSIQTLEPRLSHQN
ncbi:hypothetical protein N7457_000148 [Penicillium paradoxum]|uniref:uncharacterized protein n=1 Tax=Penicillium paradoxum TaxID=176176 RepID=UPI002546FF2F|nr:uncharacterized protein N7457_000148 [Penicillium paradoxum]KAJ5793549.1 hypothetical protein N7457_000148 [Penicillium paradoxum]